MAELRNITKKYGDSFVLKDFSLSVPQGARLALTGGSGVGKTTLLRILSGLERPDGGTVECDEKLAYMFQEPRLLPHRTALGNVKAVLPKHKRHLAEKYLEAVALSAESDAKKYPDELSGGMRQRIALARFLAYAEATDAETLILDEPFSALDADTSDAMKALLNKASEGRRLIIVTHDESDAESLGCEILRIDAPS